jgi:hypothetical protein
MKFTLSNPAGAGASRRKSASCDKLGQAAFLLLSSPFVGKLARFVTIGMTFL